MTLWFCMALIDVGIVNVALPSIQRDLGTTSADLQWILSGYALTFGVVLAAAGRAGDLLGRSGLFVAGLVIFTASSLAAALAPTPAFLNAVRFIEGVGAGIMSPQVYGTIQQYFHGAERGRAFGLLGVAINVSVALAPTLGGLLIMIGGPYWGWRLTFLVNVPLGAVGIVLASRWLPRPMFDFHVVQPAGGSAKHAGLLGSLDVVGSLVAAVAVFALLLPFVEFRASASAWLWLILAAGAIGAWVAWEKRHARRGFLPMVDLRLFAIPSFRNGLIVQTFFFLGMTSIWVLVALYAQEAAGFSAFDTGLLGMPSALASAIMSGWSGRHVTRIGRRIVVGGQLVGITGLLLTIAVVVGHSRYGLSLWWLAVTLAIFGLGDGAIVSPNQALTLEAIPVDYAGSAGALISTSQRVGASVGIAVVTGVTFATLSRSSWAVAALAGFALITLLVAASTGVAVHDLRQAQGRHLE